MFNFRICRGAGRSSADASRGTVLLMMLTDGELNSRGICVAVEDDGTTCYTVGDMYDDLSMAPDRWEELSREEAWAYREEIGKVVLYHATV